MAPFTGSDPEVWKSYSNNTNSLLTITKKSNTALYCMQIKYLNPVLIF